MEEGEACKKCRGHRSRKEGNAPLRYAVCSPRYARLTYGREVLVREENGGEGYHNQSTPGDR